MTKWTKYLLCLLCILPFRMSAQQTYTDAGREFRAGWFTTVWAIDWPQTSGEVNQKREMDAYLNRFEQLGLNACFFQVRTMCDAFYDSAYEPWSKWLTGTRGGAPTYDPFAYLIEEAHERGIEVHAWINPYRYSSSTLNNSCPEDYANTHPDWLVQCSGSSTIWILNPGLQEVRQRICDVVADIMQKYDVDGIVFDDYFYQDGFPNSADAALYRQNNPHNLSLGDWRRAQVDSMVADVYHTIQSIRPWVRFGIGPAGQAASDPAVAASYGVTPCPSSDWQYNQIYSDPLAWLQEGTIDYISPQIYWPIGRQGADYGLLSPWWYTVAHKFRRHCYVSTSLSYLTSSNASEYVNQIELNRTSNLEGAPGTVFYSCNKFTTNNFISTLSSTVLTHKVLTPAVTWYKAPDRGLVGNLTYADGVLSWSYAADSLRYAVYAVPSASRATLTGADLSSCLIGVSYSRQYSIPAAYQSGYALAVAVLDRYGHQFALRFLNEPDATAAAVTLTRPQSGASILMPSVLEWQAVADALSYRVEIAEDSIFDHILVSTSTTDNLLSTQPYAAIDGSTTYYWRVRALVPNAESAWSATQSFGGHLFSVLTPAHGATGVSAAPLITWDDAGAGASYVLHVSRGASFKASEIVYSDTTLATSVQLPSGLLNYGASYYLRVFVETPAFNAVSSVVCFSTEEPVIGVPAILSPVDQQRLTGTEITVTLEQTINNGFRVEMCQDATFPTRQTKVKSIKVGSYSCTYTGLQPGDYYLRAKAVKADGGYTEPCEAIHVVIDDNTAVADIPTPRAVKVIAGGQVFILREGKKFTILGTPAD